MENKKPNKICSITVMDTTVPDITFDEKGVCKYCRIYEALDKQYPLDETGAANLKKLVEQIKADGKGKKYDCIIGVSGGTDSTYTIHKVVEAGLRPLAVHLDNGWNSDIAVKNIKKACGKLGVDLYTYVIDWEEFKDLQLSFLKASTPDGEVPTDVAIHAILVKTAAKEGVKYVLNGHSFRTEFVMPKTWTYMDGRYIAAVQRKFGKKKLKTFPNFYLTDLVYYNFIKGIKVIPFLNYFDYQKSEAKILLKEKLDWEYSGGHHHESVYTKFYQSFYLPQKFNIDKRKIEFSAMILSGHATREEALEELETTYPFEQSTVDYVIKKLEITPEEFKQLYDLPVKSFEDYPTYYPMMKLFRQPIKWACKIGLLPSLLYYKFLD